MLARLMYESVECMIRVTAHPVVEEPMLQRPMESIKREDDDSAASEM